MLDAAQKNLRKAERQVEEAEYSITVNVKHCVCINANKLLDDTQNLIAAKQLLPDLRNEAIKLRQIFDKAVQERNNAEADFKSQQAIWIDKLKLL